MSRSPIFLALVAFASTACAADSVPLDSLGDPLPAGALVRYGSSRLRHPVELAQLTYSLDGKWLASIGGDPKSYAVVWNAEMGKAKARLEGKGFAAAAFGADGTLYVVGSKPTCLAWDPASGETRTLAPLGINDDARNGRAVCISPDGRTIAVGCDKGLIVWFDAASGKEVGRMIRRGEPDISEMKYADHSRTMAVQAGSSDLFLVDAKQFRAIRSYAADQGGNAVCCASALSPGAAWLAVSTSFNDNNGTGVRRLRLLETNSDEQGPWLRQPEASPVSLRFTPDGASLLGLTDDGKLLRYQTRDGKELSRLEICEGMKVSAFRPDASRLAIADNSGFIRIHDAVTGKLLLPLTPNLDLASATVEEDDEKLVICRDSSGKLSFWERDSGKHRQSIANAMCSGLSPDGKWLAAMNNAASGFAVRDLRTGKNLWQLPVIENAYEMQFSPDNRLLATCRADSQSIELWDVHSGQLRTSLPQPYDAQRSFLRLSWSPDARNLLVAVNNRQMAASLFRVLETATGQQRWEMSIPWWRSHSTVTAWFPSGSRLLLVQDRLLSIQHIGNSSPLREMLIPENASAAAVSADGRWIGVGFEDGSIRVWDLNGSAQLIGTGHTGAIASLQFVSGSKQLLSASADGTALMWEVAAMPKYSAPPPPSISRPDFENDWSALATVKGPHVLALFERLASRPHETVRLVRAHMRPAVAPNPKRVAQLIIDLGDSKYESRENAHRQLSVLGEQAEEMIREAASKSSTAEVRKRIDALLKEIAGPPSDPESIQELRAVELLEQIGTPEARELLESFAGGNPAARLTKESATALKRLARYRH